MNNSRGANLEHSKKIGQFDRVAFKAIGEKLFDEMFAFQRPVAESFSYANSQKNGNMEERLNMADQKNKQVEIQACLAQEQKLNVLPQLLASPSDHLLDLLLARPDFDPLAPVQRNRKRKKRKAQQEIHFKP